VISKARLKYLGVSAQKTRLVLDQVRGKDVGEALSVLHYSPKRVAQDLEKAVRSALANAQHKDPKLDVDRLYISKVYANEGSPMKRARHRSMGRLYRILKKSCHVTVELDARVVARPVTRPAAARPAGKKTAAERR
jgi:large subunit ribosomal protein L22